MPVGVSMSKTTGMIMIEGTYDKHELNEARYQASSLSIKLGSKVMLLHILPSNEDKLLAIFESGEEKPLPEEDAPDTERMNVANPA